MRDKASALGWLLVAAIAGGSAAGAAVLQTLYLDEMAEKSAVVVHVTIVGSRAEWNASRTAIRTVYSARAHQYLKGLLGGTFEFQEPGGRLNNLVMEVPGAPRFQASDEVLLFLWTDGASGRYQCIGFEQGALRVRQEGSLKLVNRSLPIRGPQALGTSRELQVLLREVAAALAQAAAAPKESR